MKIKFHESRGAFEALAKQSKTVLEIAGDHLDPGNDSAVLAFSDASLLHKRGDFEAAKRRALRSLLFSVGSMSEPFKRAQLISEGGAL